MAEVFLAKPQKGPYRGTPVALKVARSAYQDQLKKDAERLSTMRHPHVIGILPMPTETDAVQFVKKAEWNGTRSWCMALEYATGGSLRELLDRKERLPMRQAMSIAYQSLLALDYLHSKGLIHNDVKPTNILFAQPPETGRPVHVLLADFGISSWLSSDAASTFGAIPYLAPEKLGGTPGDERSDVYAVGAVLYEMLTGHAPFGNGSDKATQERILAGHFLDPEVLDHQASHVAPIVRKALALDPGERYQSAEEMIRALEDILGHQPSREPAARAAPMPWLGVVLVVLLVGLLGFLLGWLRGPGQVAGSPTPGLVASEQSTSPDAISALTSALPTPVGEGGRPTPAAAVTAEATVVVLDAATAQGAATALLTASPTSPRPPTSTPVSESPTPTTTPTSTPARSARNTPRASGAPSSGAQVARPAWLDPPEGTTLTERPIDFRWEWEGDLGDDLYFQIRVRTTQDPNGPSWGIELWRSTLQNTSIEPAARAAGVQSGEQFWVSVAVGRANRDRSALVEPVLAESPLRSMMWKPSPQPAQPRPVNPPPPTNTPGPEG